MRGSLWWYVGKRVLGIVPQLLGISLVAFLLIRMTPGNPAEALLGPNRTDQAVAALEARMGLDQPLWQQYLNFLGDAIHGDLGRSWFTGQSVLDDLVDRVPATFELIGYSLLIALVVGLLLGMVAGTREGSKTSRGILWGTRLAGSLPDFYLGLLAIFIFFYVLGIAPAPLGRLDLTVSPPPNVTGLLTVDSLIAGDMVAFRSAVGHLILPTFTLGLILSLIVARVAYVSISEVLRSDFIRYARANGLSSTVINRYVLRNACPPVITLGGILFAYLLGGAVLMEQVFSWGGVGQYAVNAVLNSDYAALQGFLILAALVTMLVYLLVDVLHILVDPRLARSSVRKD